MIALLKIVAYTDDPHGRRKDLLDLRLLLHCYEASSDRIFGDDVFAADLEDIECAGAFLLGSDLGAMATEEEAELVNAFLSQQQVPTEELADLDRHDPQQADALRFQMQLRAFRRGFDASRHGRPRQTLSPDS